MICAFPLLVFLIVNIGNIWLVALSAIPFFWSPYLGISLVFMLLYVWSREFPNAQVNIYGLVSLKAFYLPWAMLALDVIFGSPIMPDLLGIMAGHLYYFLTVLYPLSSEKHILKTPNWVYPFTSIILLLKFSIHCIASFIRIFFRIEN
ncbi:hypothetical protein GIB67_004577 [Kingdonia uniflora]|uniref:Derlin n=1 Tax=Kingdonia uniflora TaxID=39325 RepID=A0A7J7ML20_9MAGN|nr:hypothetical protein GIB67_004577 [Kingdonia uniflora]